MNSTSKRSHSLYHIIQNTEPPPLSAGIDPLSLQSYVATIMEVLGDREVRATIVLKPPQSQDWFSILNLYLEESQIESVYLCGDASDSSSKNLADATLVSNKIIPIILGKASRLKRECFCLVIASNFCSLVLGQWQKGQIKIAASGKRLQQPYLETLFSFESLLIKKFIAEIQKIIQENNPDLKLSLEDIIVNENSSESRAILTNLLIKQLIKVSNLAPNTSKINSNDNQEANSLANTLGLQADFLNNLVAEMRSPVTYMKTTISLLSSKQIKGEQRQRYLKMLEQQCDRQNSVISGLLELLQLDISTAADTIYLDDFVPGIVSTYQPLANENNIQLGYTIPANLPPIIFPASWLRQIIIQLLNNSLQFTPPQGRVFVQATLKELKVELTIGDTGRGIESQELTKIFDSFYRTKTASNDRITGAGLGLTIVRQLVEKSGGEISVTSKVDKGSSFKILFPAVPPELLE